VAVVEPGLADVDRLRGLTRWFPLVTVPSAEILRDLLEDRERRWRRSWLSACALYAASGLSDPALDVASPGGVETWMTLGSHDESDIVHETLTGLRERRWSGV
jgi:hypothetical protein